MPDTRRLTARLLRRAVTQELAAGTAAASPPATGPPVRAETWSARGTRKASGATAEARIDIGNPVTFNDAGDYYWQADYSGDANNEGSTSACGVEQFTIDYQDKRLTLKLDNGRTYNFTTKTADADPLLGPEHPPSASPWDRRSRREPPAAEQRALVPCRLCRAELGSPPGQGRKDRRAHLLPRQLRARARVAKAASSVAS